MGNNLINTIKSAFLESPAKKLETSKENLKGLYKTYVDLKDVKPQVKDLFLKNHYEKIDKIQDPEVFLEKQQKLQNLLCILEIKKLIT
ncbi:MAG: hypothetical protein AB8U25_04600 [Rickettsiales endosymbiont of Dermacentor nuttalli]